MSYKLTATEMRNAKHLVTNNDKLEEVLHKENVCRIALVDDGEPYIVPMSYGYRKGSLYLHCAQEGRKLDIIRRGNHLVCFEVESGVTEPPVHYISIVGLGRVHIIEDKEGADEALDILCSHFAEEYQDWRKMCKPELREKTVALRIDIEEMTGKQRLYDEWAKSDPDHSH